MRRCEYIGDCSSGSVDQCRSDASVERRCESRGYSAIARRLLLRSSGRHSSVGEACSLSLTGRRSGPCRDRSSDSDVDTKGQSLSQKRHGTAGERDGEGRTDNSSSRVHPQSAASRSCPTGSRSILHVQGHRFSADNFTRAQSICHYYCCCGGGFQILYMSLSGRSHLAFSRYAMHRLVA